jgi:hypothetical protein
MDHTTSDTLDQADEDILTPTVSDEAIEAAGEMKAFVTIDTSPMCCQSTLVFC